MSKGIILLLVLTAMFSLNFVDTLGAHIHVKDTRHHRPSSNSSSLGNTVDGLVGQILQLVQKIVDTVTGAVGSVGLLQPVLEPVLLLVKSLQATVGEALAQVKLSPTVDGVTAAVGTVIPLLNSVVTGVSVAGGGLVGTLNGPLLNTVQGTVKGLVGQVSQLFGQLQTAGESNTLYSVNKK